MSQITSVKPSQRLTIGLVLAATVIAGGTLYYGWSKLATLPSPSPAQTTPSQPVVQKVTALGRLEPEAEVIRVATPQELSGDRVAELLVEEGSRVKQGDVIAILGSRDRLQAAVNQARQQIKVAEAKLAQVQAGAKTGEIEAQRAAVGRVAAEQITEIDAQRAKIARLQAEQETESAAQQATIRQLQAQLANAQAEDQRYQALYDEGAVSISVRDTRRLTLDTTRQQVQEAQANLRRIQTSRQQQLKEAQANLRRIQTSREQELKQSQATLDQVAEVRTVDVQAAQTEVDSAITALRQAETNLAQAYIRAPMPGQILKIHTRQGEEISDDGVVDLGQTSQMVAVAEIYQTDIGKIQVGQTVEITGQAFPGLLKGTVSRIDLQVSRQNVFSNQPGENLDRRVVEVEIRLTPDDSDRVASLTNLQVQTAILLGGKI
jgi:HlyD family secretion protein